MKDFAAIDFETANGRRTSICSVGVVVVRGGEVVDTLYSLIRPRPNFYSRFTTAIHGLSYEDTAQAPDFADVWKQIAPRIEGLPLVAHNSPFDEGCLRAVFELYGMPYPGYRFYCTCRASRRTFGSSLPNHQLHTVSAACGFDLANHHHALADAEADRAENPVTGFLSRNRNSRQQPGVFLFSCCRVRAPAPAGSGFPSCCSRGRTIRCGGCTTCRPVLSGCDR